jgi:hypothetical protein
MKKPSNQILETLRELVENAISEHDGFEFLIDSDSEKEQNRYDSEKKDLQMVFDWLDEVEQEWAVS